MAHFKTGCEVHILMNKMDQIEEVYGYEQT